MEKFRAMWFDCKSLAVTFYSSIVSNNICEPIKLNFDGTKNPIILVNGSGDNKFSWSQFASSLPKNHPVYAFTMDLSFDENTGLQEIGMNPLSQRLYTNNKDTSVEDYANQVTKYISYVFTIYQKPVILIGMSMGGLVVRYCETVLKNPHICRIITLSSPHKGAPLLKYTLVKKLFSTTRHSQMTPDSDFLINEEFKVSNIDKYTTIGTLHDIHVPNDYSQIDGVTHITINDCGHLGITKSLLVMKFVNEILQDCV